MSTLVSTARPTSPFVPFAPRAPGPTLGGSGSAPTAAPIRPIVARPVVVPPATSHSQAVARAPPPYCPHLGQAVAASHALIDRCLLALRWARKRERDAAKRKPSPARCSTCGVAPSRAALCLDCGEVLCVGRAHARRHLEKSRHAYYLDARTSAIFCLACADYVYHPMLSGLCAVHISVASPSTSAIAGLKRKRADYRPWRSSAESKVLVAQSAKIRACESIRGIRNLGATCFLNVVLQSLLHNPLIRGHFLADRHSIANCPIALAALKDPPGRPCMSCELDRVFSEIYADASGGQPYAPTSLLQASWLSFRDLAGYSQQDAHEYLVATLDALHATSPEHLDSGDAPCPCLVHRTFSGELRSDVTCGKCGHTTTARDPYLDLSLDIRSASSAGGDSVAEQASTLFSCLDRYTSPERLGVQQYACAKCGTGASDATKRLRISALPPVLCIQLKRFEHAAGSRKIDTQVRFPLRLDMAPYVVDARSADAAYELFAVVTHEGKLDTGHYYIHVRQRDNWALINDDVVTPASLRDVLDTNPYLLFYARATLAYDAPAP